MSQRPSHVTTPLRPPASEQTATRDSELPADDAKRLTPSTPPFAGVLPESSVSVLVLRGLLAAVEPLGVTREQLLAAVTDLPERLDDPDARVSLRSVHDACGAALQLTGDPALGLRWAGSSSATSFAPLSNLISHSASRRQGL